MQYVLEGGEAALRFYCARTAACGRSVPRPKYPVLERRSQRHVPWCRVAIDAFVAPRCVANLTSPPFLSSHVARDDNISARMPATSMQAAKAID
jgi:hypothetical protein